MFWKQEFLTIRFRLSIGESTKSSADKNKKRNWHLLEKMEWRKEHWHQASSHSSPSFQFSIFKKMLARDKNVWRKLCRCPFLLTAVERKEFSSSNYLRIFRLTVKKNENNIHDNTNIYFCSSNFFSVIARRRKLLFCSKRAFLVFLFLVSEMTLRRRRNNGKKSSLIIPSQSLKTPKNITFASPARI